MKIDGMSDLTKCGLIAEFCGINDQNECPSCHLYRGQGHASFCTYVPDYLNSLDAMHEAEKMLTDEQCLVYDRELGVVVNPSSHFKGAQGFHHVCFQMIHATARQRADALLSILPESVNADTKEDSHE